MADTNPFMSVPEAGAAPASANSNPFMAVPEANAAPKSDENFDARDYKAQSKSGVEGAYSGISKMVAGAKEGLTWEQTAPGMIHDRMKDIHAVEPQLKKDWDAEIARRKEKGESLNGMENWRLHHLNELVAQHHHTTLKEYDNLSDAAAAVRAGFTENYTGLKQEFATNPWGLAGKFGVNMITNPELWGFGPGVTIGLVALESAQQQQNVSGNADPGATAFAVATVGVPVAGGKLLHAGVKKLTKAPIEQPDAPKVREAPTPESESPALLGFPPTVSPSAEIALDLGLARTAKKTGTVVTPDTLQKAKKAASERAQAGVDPGQAVIDTLKAFGLDEHEAKPLGEAVARRAENEKATDQRVQQEHEDANRHEGGSLLSKSKAEEGQGKRSEDLPKRDGAEPQDGQGTQGQEQDQVAALLQKVPPVFRMAKEEMPALLRKYGPAAGLGAAAYLGMQPFSDEDKQMMAMVGAVGLSGFYSPLEHAIFKADRFTFNKQGTIKADQFLSRLDSLIKDGKIAKEEVDYLGLKEYLGSGRGADISKAELAEFLDSNGIQMTEKILGEAGRTPGEYLFTPELQQELEHLERSPFTSTKSFDKLAEDTLKRLRKYGDQDSTYKEMQSELNTARSNIHRMDELRAIERRDLGEEVGEPAPFHTLQLEGEMEPRSQGVLSFQMPDIGRRGTGERFRSQHYQSNDVPNQVGTIRFNMRRIGNDLMFHIEELQSDLAKFMKHKFGGIKTDHDAADIARVNKELEVLYNEEEHLMTKSKAVGFERIADKERWRALQDEIDSKSEELYYTKNRLDPAAADNPFVGKKEQWVPLALKRALQYAVDKGAKGLTWTDAEQQIARYASERSPEKQARFEKGMRDFYGKGGTLETELRRILDDMGLKDIKIGRENYISKEALRQLQAEHETRYISEPRGGDRLPKTLAEQPGLRFTPEGTKAVLDARNSYFRQKGASNIEALGVIAGVGLGAVLAKAWNPDNPNYIAGMVLGGALPLLGGKYKEILAGTKRVYEEAFKLPIENPKEVYRKALGNYARLEYDARNFRNNVNALKNLPFMERKLHPERQKAIDINIRDWLQGHRDMVLKPNELAAAELIQAQVDQIGDMAVQAGILSPESVQEWRGKYLTGLYDTSPATITEMIDKLVNEGGYSGDGMWPRTRFSREKIIPDYRTAERIGLRPRTTDPAEITEIYMRSMGHTMMVKSLVNDLKKTQSHIPYASGNGYVPLIVEHTPDANRLTIYKHAMIRANQLGYPESIGKLWAEQDIQNSPKDYVFLNHPALQGVKVHQAIAPAMKLLFDVNEIGHVQRALLNVSLGAKTLYFATSFFHPATLAVATAATLLPRTLRLDEFKRVPEFWKNMKLAQKGLHHELVPELEQAAYEGLTFIHSPEDINNNVVDKALGSLQRWATALPTDSDFTKGLNFIVRHGTGITAMREVNKAFNHILWDQIWPNLKVATYLTEKQYAIEKNVRQNMKDPQKTPLKSPEEIGRDVASGANDILGGQNWFERINNIDGKMARALAMNIFSPQGRRWQQVVALAPDWVYSSLHAWTKMGQSALPFAWGDAANSMYRAYILWSAAAYAVTSQAIYSAYNPDGWSPDNPGGHWYWQVDNPNDAWGVPLGDGRYIQTNKHFNEMVHLVYDPKKFILNKLGPIPTEALEQLTSREFMTKSGGPPMTTPPLEHFAEKLLPITWKNMAATPEGQLNWELSFFGIQITSMEDAQKAELSAAKAESKALSKGKSEYEAKTEADKVRERRKKQLKRAYEDAHKMKDDE